VLGKDNVNICFSLMLSQSNHKFARILFAYFT